MKLLLMIAIAILAVGCGGKDESTSKTKPVEEKVLEAKEEVKTEETLYEIKPKEEKALEVTEVAQPKEPHSETKAELEGVGIKELEYREGHIAYQKGSDTPYTGKVYSLHPNGQMKLQRYYNKGKEDGIWTTLFANGQKQFIETYNAGKKDGLEAWWHENGQKFKELYWKDNIVVQDTRKWWNSKGDRVETGEEAIAE